MYIYMYIEHALSEKMREKEKWGLGVVESNKKRKNAMQS